MVVVVEVLALLQKEKETVSAGSSSRGKQAVLMTACNQLHNHALGLWEAKA